MEQKGGGRMTVCPKCNGRGTVGYFHIDHFADIECDRCNGSGEVSEVEMTNEEYLKSLNTEQLAEWIAHQTMIALLENQNNHSLLMTYPAYWVEWLKQPHTFKKR